MQMLKHKLQLLTTSHSHAARFQSPVCYTDPIRIPVFFPPVRPSMTLQEHSIYLGRITKLSLWFVFVFISCCVRFCDCMQDWSKSLESRWIDRGQGGRTSVKQRLQSLRVEQTDTFISCVTRQRVRELRLVDKLPQEIHKTARQLIDENWLFFT